MHFGRSTMSSIEACGDHWQHFEGAAQFRTRVYVAHRVRPQRRKQKAKPTIIFSCSARDGHAQLSGKR